MKLEPRRIEAFLSAPGAVRAALFYGEDAGLVADRAARLVRAVAGSADDPFRVVDLDRDAAALIPEEMASLALTGGRRVVRVREATDAMSTLVERALAGAGPALLVIEAGSLPARSRLRVAIERASDAVAIPCYAPDAAAIGGEIRGGLQGLGVTIAAPALAWLTTQLGGDLATTRGEVEKLALYVGNGGVADLAAAQACVGDVAGLSLEDAVFAATAGDVGEADRAIELALAEGASPVGVIRVALTHIQRLHRARQSMRGGASPSEAVKGLRPPLFFRREQPFTSALRLWPEDRLAAAATALWRIERACKRTGAPAEMLCRNAVLGIALRARTLRAS